MKIQRPESRGFVAAALGAAFFASLAMTPSFAQGPNPLNIGKRITPPQNAVKQDVGSLPMNLILTPNKKYAITTDMGFRQELWSIDTATGKGVDHLVFGDPMTTSSQGLYFGLAAKDNGDGTTTLYAGQGSNNTIAVIKVAKNGALSLENPITETAPPAPYPPTANFTSGLALDGQGHLYVVNNEEYSAAAVNSGSSDVNSLLTPGNLAIYDTATGTQLAVVPFVKPFGAVTLSPTLTVPFTPTTFPLAVAVLKDGSKAYVTSQRDGVVYVVDPATSSVVNTLQVGSHPIALLLNKAQTRLYVANAHSDDVSIFNTSDDSAAGTLLLRPDDAQGVPGVTPTNLALSEDEKTLYVSLGDMDAVAVADVSSAGNPYLKGYVPAGWYPTGVAVTPEGKLMVANAKGTKTRYPNPLYAQYQFNSDPEYDLNLIEGNVLTFSVPGGYDLKADTAQVLKNNKIARVDADPNEALARIGLSSGKITHVIYIIKENRTYDQILGDDKRGNGQANLALFGKSVTPNLHALANRFVLFDNFFDCGEASGDGWPWSTQSIATEYVIKNLPYNYSNRGRNYDFEGQQNGYPAGGFAATDASGNPTSFAFPNGGPAIPDVSEAPSGHIWDAVKDAGLSYRNYGFFETFGVTGIIPDNYPCETNLRDPGHDLAGQTDADYRRFDTSYADSDAPHLAGLDYPTATYGKHNAVSRFDEFKTEFDEMLKAGKGGSAVPNFIMMRLMSDHTAGMSSAGATPMSHVADNDYAVGEVVNLVSHSKIWEHTAIFVIEDDAQDGPDHVDCHRSTCYVISPYIKAATVDHAFHNTDSVLKTMETLLGLSPLSQYDAVANPILDFSATPDNNAPYTLRPESKSIINGRNPTMAMLKLKHDPALAKLVALSNKMDFVHPDSAPAQLLNEIVWKSVKGVNAKMPAPRHGLKSQKITGAREASAAHADPDAD